MNSFTVLLALFPIIVFAGSEDNLSDVKAVVETCFKEVYKPAVGDKRNSDFDFILYEINVAHCINHKMPMISDKNEFVGYQALKLFIMIQKGLLVSDKRLHGIVKRCFHKKCTPDETITWFALCIFGSTRFIRQES